MENHQGGIYPKGLRLYCTPRVSEDETFSTVNSCQFPPNMEEKKKKKKHLTAVSQTQSSLSYEAIAMLMQVLPVKSPITSTVCSPSPLHTIWLLLTTDLYFLSSRRRTTVRL